MSAAWRRTAVVLGLVGLAGCDALGPPEAQVDVPTLTIPAPRPPKREKTVAEALAVFPTLDEVKRDPFLTEAEQEAAEHGTPVKEDVVVPPPVVARGHRPKKRAIPVLDEMDLVFRSLSTIAGRQHAVAYDRKTGRDLQIDEGEEFGPWVVTGISEDAIRLKEKNGPHTETFRFQVAAATNPWEMKP